MRSNYKLIIFFDNFIKESINILNEKVKTEIFPNEENQASL